MAPVVSRRMHQLPEISEFDMKSSSNCNNPNNDSPDKSPSSKNGRKSKTSWVVDPDSRSLSPSPSLKSSHSTKSVHSATHSEVGDSGVSSERDSPSPHQPSSLNTASSPSESDNDSSVSTDSLHEQQPPPFFLLKNRRLKQAQKPKPPLPGSLLRQICERARMFEKRRQKLAKAEATNITMLRGLVIRGRPSMSSRMTHSSSDSSTSSLLSSASLFSSTTSLILEEDEMDEERSLGARTSMSCDDDLSSGTVVGSSGLFEHAEQNAGVAFAGIRDIFSPPQQSTIRSHKGTVRGVRNRVRAGIATFTTDHRLLKVFNERERGRVVVFMTTMGIVRHTFERCQRIRKILWTLMVQFEERDVFMARDTQLQLLDRLGSKVVSLPHIFIEGQYLGGADLIEHLNETGDLRRLLQPYRVPFTNRNPCESCGGYRMLPCPICCGSKKSLNRNHFTLEFVALKCCCCDESGLVRCEECR